MKKLSILLIGLLLITGFAVAQEFDGGVSVDGSASVTFGVDLDANATGFLNTASSSVTITLVADTDVSASGDDGLYGEITVSGLEIEADGAGISGDNGSVEAKIVISPVEIIIYDAPGMAWDRAAILDGPDLGADLIETNTIGGITIVVPVDPLTLSIYFVSDGDWDPAGAGQNLNNDYAIGTDVEVAVSIVTLDIGFFYGWFNAATWGAAVGTAVDLDVLSGVTIDIGADIVDQAGTLAWEVAFGTAVLLNEDETEVSVDVSYSETADLDVALGVSEPESGGFVDMLSATLGVELFDLLGVLIWNVDLDGSYNAGGLKPYFGVGLGSDNVVDINAGVELSADFTGIDNTTVTIDYETADINVSNGIITVDVTVDY